MKIVSVVAARPNFMKIAPLCHAIDNHNRASEDKIEHILVHTGQHYDNMMSKHFFESLNIPEADINLNIGSGSHAEQVGLTMIEFEKVLLRERPDWVIVVGDVNATCACSITAKKLQIKVAHIEAGLRSRDMAMPEEINRLVTDRISDLLLTPDTMASDNLRAEGVPDKNIKFVGNIMIDTLEANREKAEKLDVNKILRENSLDASKAENVNLERNSYAVITMHRPSNVDHPEVFKPIIDFLTDEVAVNMPLIWPIHPRSEKQLKKFDLWGKIAASPQLLLTSPLGYHDLLKMNLEARIILTDSGGLQEESCVIGTPCLTLRWNTERPVTLREHGGMSALVGNNVERIRNEYMKTLEEPKRPCKPELWDGKTAERIVDELLAFREN